MSYIAAKLSCPLIIPYHPLANFYPWQGLLRPQKTSPPEYFRLSVCELCQKKFLRGNCHFAVIAIASVSICLLLFLFSCRLYLAAMYYNENAGREQKRKKDGSVQWKTSFPRSKGGDYVLQKVLDNPTKGYTEINHIGCITATTLLSYVTVVQWYNQIISPMRHFKLTACIVILGRGVPLHFEKNLSLRGTFVNMAEGQYCVISDSWKLNEGCFFQIFTCTGIALHFFLFCCICYLFWLTNVVRPKEMWHKKMLTRYCVVTSVSRSFKDNVLRHDIFTEFFCIVSLHVFTEYVDDLLTELIRLVLAGKKNERDNIPGLFDAPSPLAHGMVHPTLEEAVERQQTRFASAVWIHKTMLLS